MLLEFSAPWCEDCVVLERLKGAEPLAQEMDAWELLPINIGGGFEHPALMRAYRVNAIAKLVSVHPRKCSDPLTTWIQGSARTLDGITRQKDRAGRTLADWLRAERERLRRARGTD